MSQTIRKSSQVAKRYANSLLDLTEEKPGLETVKEDVEKLVSILSKSEELARAIKDPRIKQSDKKAVVQAIAEKIKIDKSLVGFLNAIAENKRLKDLLPVLEAVLEEVKGRRGIVDAHVVVANNFDQKYETDLKKSLIKSFGTNINLSIEKDESLLGGLVLKVGSVMVDDSVKNKLLRLERQMISGQTPKQQIKEVA